MSAVFGADRVFMDVDDVAPGQNFAQTIDNTIAVCQAVLVVIGPRWMEILRERSQASQRDYVTHEIEAALARKIPVIPVLVGGASIAQLAGLSGKLAGLPLYQAAELRDSTFKEDCNRLAKSLGARNRSALRKPIMLAVGGVALAILLLGFIGMGPWSEYRARKSRIERLAATARTQADRTEYESAFGTYRDLLKVDPDNRSALDLQVDAAMRWLQNFHVIVGEGQKAEDIAGPALSEIMSVLDAGLARTNGAGPRAADILAHLGWAHWLNQRIALKEFGSAAERDLRQALLLDPANVFAHAMLGNWLLQTNGDVDEAQRHFDAAVRSGKERSLVRQMQLGGLESNYDAGIRSKLFKVANEMRLNGEPLGDRHKRRILSALHPGLNSAAELRETLSSLPPKDVWATFLWLDDKEAEGSDRDVQRIRHEFIHASILEIEGRKAEALAEFEKLGQELKVRGARGRTADHVADAVKRLSR